jgi:hypothetical protein
MGVEGVQELDPEVVEEEDKERNMLNISSVTNWVIIRVNVQVGVKMMQIMQHLMIVKKCSLWHSIKIQFRPKVRYGSWTQAVVIIW